MPTDKRSASPVFPSEPVGWQPIETAPKDQFVLLYSEKAQYVAINRWGQFREYNNPRFSHWMPLPPAPGSAPPPSPRDEAVEALRELLTATIADCGDPDDFPSDDGGVATYSDGRESVVTFAIIRRARAALAGLGSLANTQPPPVVEALRELVAQLDDLMSQSGGVYGLHLNGDAAPWNEITSGGRYEEWLDAHAKAKDALAGISHVRDTQPPPSPSNEVVEALRKLRFSARLLHQNAVACVEHHHGLTPSETGWLADCLKSIESAEAILAKLSGSSND